MNKEKLNDSTVEFKNEGAAPKVTHNPKRLSFENAGSSQQAPKKAKKSLEAGWDSSTASDISYLIETPVSSYFRVLITSTSVFFRLFLTIFDFVLGSIE